MAIKKESILKVTLTDGSNGYIFSDKRGGAILTPESRLASAVIGTGLGFIAVKKGDTRDTDTFHVNVAHIVKYEKSSSTVPSNIVDLYIIPENEDEVEKVTREIKIKAYFDLI